MKISGFLPLSLNDYPGIPATVVFTQGCNFNCPFCHNPSLIPGESQNPCYSTKEVILWLKQRKKMMDGVVISGGEPTLQTDLEEFMKEVRCLGYQIKLDTNGSQPKVIDSILRQKLVDYVAMDIKAPLDKYPLLSGVRNFSEIVRESMALIVNSRTPHHFRTTYYKKFLSEEDLEEIKKTLHDSSRYVVQAYKEK